MKLDRQESGNSRQEGGETLSLPCPDSDCSRPTSHDSERLDFAPGGGIWHPEMVLSKVRPEHADPIETVVPCVEKNKGSMGNMAGGPKRRVFWWSQEARQMAMDYQEQLGKVYPRHGDERRRLATELAEISGNPRDACLRFLRRLGVAEKRSFREWTKPEQQRLVELIDSGPVEEAARILRRPPASVRAMLYRLGLGGRRSREWFTVSLLAQALHIGRNEVQRWVDRGWLQCRVVQTNGLKIRIIDADDFCDFIKRYGREVVGRRLSYEGLVFVQNYVFPRRHADLLSVRGSYNKAATNADEVAAPSSDFASEEDGEKDAVDESAGHNSEVA